MAIPSAEYGTAKYGESLYGTVIRNLTDTVTVSDSILARDLKEHRGGIRVENDDPDQPRIEI